MQGRHILRCAVRAACLSFSLAAAVAAAQEVVLGQVGPFTVIPVPDAPELNQGIQAFVKQANKAGGIRGSKVSFFDLDDRYSADGFVEQYGKALERRPVALLAPIGSAALTRMLNDKLLDKGDMVIVNAIPGAESLRSPGHPRLFHLRAGDKQQIEKIVNHARTLGTTKMAVLYQDLAIGTSGWAVAEQAAKDVGGLELKGVKSGTEAAALAAAAQAMKQLEPQSVLIVGAPRFMADGVAALRKAEMRQSLFVLSYVPPGLIVKLAGAEGARGVGIAQTYPNPNGITLPVQRDFQAAMKAAHPNITTYTSFQLEGYLTARTVAEALRRAKDPALTPANLEKALHAAGEMDFGGYRVDFSKGNVGSKWVDIGVINADGKLRY
ncbi:ABC transporter substrate-binding protein [Ramlibacter sp. XY19]|uniref:ABC transporter substrate-binding protein n=1 Tax=Ramlibacter paludis TaxID=2908000 RepID=UPI0023DC50F9|nr:ABC transporter substrate-binding protein [Ramlibacter paludis]MCG2595149.1 ABC transporter substrate-binding protein [Ramlibacter paludis]